MAFPNDIETGIGLAGPTANIGHADAHAANGVPRMLELLQTTIGTGTTGQNGKLALYNQNGNAIADASASSIGQGYSIWRMGPLAYVSINISWQNIAATYGTSTTITEIFAHVPPLDAFGSVFSVGGLTGIDRDNTLRYAAVAELATRSGRRGFNLLTTDENLNRLGNVAGNITQRNSTSYQASGLVLIPT